MEAHPVELHRYLVHEIKGSLYLQRTSNDYFVWLGYKKHVQSLEDAQISALISYRLAFDARCCKRVN